MPIQNDQISLKSLSLRLGSGVWWNYLIISSELPYLICSHWGVNGRTTQLSDQTMIKIVLIVCNRISRFLHQKWTRQIWCVFFRIQSFLLIRHLFFCTVGSFLLNMWWLFLSPFPNYSICASNHDTELYLSLWRSDWSFKTGRVVFLPSTH